MNLEDVSLIPVDQIDDSVYPTRTVQDDQHMQELVESVKSVGILLPLIVIQQDDERFALVAGHRRLRAAKLCDLAAVPCLVGDWDQSDIDRIRVHENLYRVGMTAVDEGLLYERMHIQSGLKVNEIASIIGKSPSYVSQRVTLLNAEPEIVQAVKDERMSFAVAREIMGIKNPTKRMYYFRFALDDGASQRTVRRWKDDANLQDITGVNYPDVHPTASETGEPVPEPDPIGVDEAVNLGSSPGADGYFRCVCGVVCHASNASQTPYGWRCGLCLQEERRKPLPPDSSGPCAVCGTVCESEDLLTVSLCRSCNDHIEKVLSERG